MGATNTTTSYNLSQFISTDKPAWLQDYNGDMLKIDTAINAAKVAADNAALAAGTAQSTADGAVSSLTTLSATVGTHTTAITNLSGAVNTINSLIGNGTPTTTDQTIIGAINEINAKVTVLDNESANVSVSSDGVKTNRQLLNELYAAIDPSKITKNSKFVSSRTGSTSYFQLSSVSTTEIEFANNTFVTPGIFNRLVILNASTSSNVYSNCPDINSPSFTAGNDTSTVPTAGLTYGIIY